MPERKSIRVQILNREYALRVFPEDEAFTRRVAASVDERMRSIREAVSDRTDLTVAILAALSFAEEVHLLQEREAAAERQIRHLLDMLEDLLSASEAGERDSS